MKNMDSDVREKAIEIANALLEEGYEEGRAIAIAQAQTKKSAGRGGSTPSAPDVHVVPHPKGWAVHREGNKRASNTFETKDDAVARAKDLAEDDGGDVVLHDSEGRIQKHQEA